MTGTLSVYDASLGVTIEPTTCKRNGMPDDAHARPSFHRSLNLLRELGFTVGPDQSVASIIRDAYHRGEHPSGLKFRAEVYPRGWKIEFYQDIVHENRHGGFYDYDKIRKMPYLIRLRFWHSLRKVIALLRSLGMEDETRPQDGELPAIDMIRWHIQTSGHFAGGDPLVDWKPCPRVNGGRNATDRDGKLIEPGQVKWFYSRWNPKGHLLRGRVYYRLNCSWSVLLNERQYVDVQGYELFDWTLGTPRRRPTPARERREKLQSELKTAATAENFERAIVLRDLIRKESTAC